MTHHTSDSSAILVSNTCFILPPVSSLLVSMIVSHMNTEAKGQTQCEKVDSVFCRSESYTFMLNIIHRVRYYRPVWAL
jgi:hypothetical protein